MWSSMIFKTIFIYWTITKWLFSQKSHTCNITLSGSWLIRWQFNSFAAPIWQIKNSSLHVTATRFHANLNRDFYQYCHPHAIHDFSFIDFQMVVIIMSAIWDLCNCYLSLLSVLARVSVGGNPKTGNPGPNRDELLKWNTSHLCILWSDIRLQQTL